MPFDRKWHLHWPMHHPSLPRGGARFFYGPTCARALKNTHTIKRIISGKRTMASFPWHKFGQTDTHTQRHLTFRCRSCSVLWTRQVRCDINKISWPSMCIHTKMMVRWMPGDVWWTCTHAGWDGILPCPNNLSGALLLHVECNNLMSHHVPLTPGWRVVEGKRKKRCKRIGGHWGRGSELEEQSICHQLWAAPSTLVKVLDERYDDLHFNAILCDLHTRDGMINVGRVHHVACLASWTKNCKMTHHDIFFCLLYLNMQ